MSKKLKNEELKNVSGGGCGKDDDSTSSQNEQTFYCSTCQKTYLYSEIILDSADDGGKYRCPKCNKVLGTYSMD